MHRQAAIAAKTSLVLLTKTVIPLQLAENQIFRPQTEEQYVLKQIKKHIKICFFYQKEFTLQKNNSENLQLCK